MTILREEIDTFESHRAEFEADHWGQWVLVRGNQIIAFFDEFNDVAAAAVQRFGRGPYLIRQVGSPATSLPASVMFRPLNA